MKINEGEIDVKKATENVQQAMEVSEIERKQHLLMHQKRKHFRLRFQNEIDFFFRFICF